MDGKGMRPDEGCDIAGEIFSGFKEVNNVNSNA
jgi:hypothetical protein